MKVSSLLLLVGLVSCVTRHDGIVCPPERMGDPECGSYMCPAGQMVMGNMCVAVGACPMGQRNGGGGVCVPEGQCADGYHNGGDPRGTCVPVGMCTADYIDDGAGGCVQDTNACAMGFHDDGTHNACVRTGKCAMGFHNGGDGSCVETGMCGAGYHDGGSGNCLPDGMCSAGFHDGCDGKCVSLDACSPMCFNNGVDTCVRDTASCAMGFHDGGHMSSCLPGTQCDPGADWDAAMRRCVDNGSGGGGGAGGEGGGTMVPPCCDLPPPTDPCGMPGATCSLSGRNMVRFAGGSSGDNVQVRVDLPAAWVGMSLRADCSDLMFREMDGTWAPHWVEDCMATGGPRVWVRVKRLDATAGATLSVFHGGNALPAAQSFDRVFDRVPEKDPALMGAWTFDEGMGAATRHLGPAARFWYAPQGSTDPAVAISGSSSLTAAIWGPPGVGWGTRRDVGFTTGHSFKSVDRTTFRVPGSETPHPDRGITMGIWFKTNCMPNQIGATGDCNRTTVDWATPISLGAPEGWGNGNGSDIFNPYALFIWQSGPDRSRLQGNTCHGPCMVEGDYNHIASDREYLDRELTGSWHFLAMSYDVATQERHLFFDGEDLPLHHCDPPMDTRICDWFLNRVISTGAVTFTPAPLTIGSDFNNGVDGLSINGWLDDAFILNRMANAAELQAFMERRQPIALPTATVM